VGWVVKPGDRIFVSRTAVIPSKQLSRKGFKAPEDTVNIYTRMLGEMILIHLEVYMGSI
jgi:hypothetical protein